MDHGWIRTYGSSQRMSVQISIAQEGGSGTSAPDLSIEVDDLDAALQRMKAARIAIEYGPADEPWGAPLLCARPIWATDQHTDAQLD